jgi:hypothetical protein
MVHYRHITEIGDDYIPEEGTVGHREELGDALQGHLQSMEQTKIEQTKIEQTKDA